MHYTTDPRILKRVRIAPSALGNSFHNAHILVTGSN